MNFDKQWRGWRLIERTGLWTAFGLCLFVAAAPLRERFTAWQSQHTLESQWQHAVETHVHLVNHVGTKKARLRGHSASDRSVSKSEETPLWPLVRLSCSTLGLDAIVVQGTSATQLKRGPGHELDTSFPGGPNCVIAAHRNAYGWWFYRLNRLKNGDTIVLQTPERKFIYRVAASRRVSVRDTSILHHRSKAAPRLTLYTCTLPKTTWRLVVIANLQKSQPH